MDLLLHAPILWLVAYVVYHLNPMYDRSNPASDMHYYSYLNCKGREAFEEKKRKDKKAVMLEWDKLQTYVYSTGITALCLIIETAIRLLL